MIPFSARDCCLQQHRGYSSALSCASADCPQRNGEKSLNERGKEAILFRRYFGALELAGESPEEGEGLKLCWRGTARAALLLFHVAPHASQLDQNPPDKHDQDRPVDLGDRTHRLPSSLIRACGACDSVKPNPQSSMRYSATLAIHRLGFVSIKERGRVAGEPATMPDLAISVDHYRMAREERSLTIQLPAVKL